MTPYRGPRMRQVSSQWEWEEEKEAERLKQIREDNIGLRKGGNVFFERKIGWFQWAIMERGSDGFVRVSVRGFWRWIDAARAVNELIRIRNDALSES